MITYLATLPFPSVDPVLVRLGPLAIRWYGIAYVAAFAIAYALLRRMVRSGALRMTKTELSDCMSYLVIGVLLGGRLGWWLFYSGHWRINAPWYEPLAIWHGGMSFHGGLAGVAIALAIWTRRTKGSFLNFADCAAFVTPIGLFLGRLANFINAELVGRPSDLPWAVVFPGEHFSRHPSQLYEAILEGPILFVALWVFRRTQRFEEGQLAASFLIFYGTFRSAVEFIRQPDTELGFIAFGWITMGQVLSLVLIAAGVVFFYTRRHQPFGSFNMRGPASA